MRYAAIVLLLVLAGTAYAVARAPLGTTVTECDRLAADPFDPQRVAPGAADADILPPLAIAACEKDAGRHPESLRVQYQLGRAYRAGREWQKAADAFERAGEYAPALYARADRRLADYWTAANNADDVAAAEVLDDVEMLLDRASEYPPTAATLNSLRVQADDFRMTITVDHVSRQEWGPLDAAAPAVAAYLFGIHKSLSQHFHPVEQSCPAYVSTPAVAYTFERTLVGGPGSGLGGLFQRVLGELGKFLGRVGAAVTVDPVYLGNPDKWRTYLEDIGHADGDIFALRYGCGSPALHDFYANTLRWALRSHELKDYAKGMALGTALREAMPELVPYIEPPAADPAPDVPAVNN